LSIIELILNNFFLVIIIFAVISFLLQKLFGTAPAKPAGGGGMPPFGGEPNRSGTGRLKLPSQNPTPSSVNPNNAVSTSIDQGRTRSKDKSIISVEQNTKTTIHRNANSKQVLTFTANQRLSIPAQGMMWAEVFGSPRSKKPHQARKW
jgi:hypothetical protein